MEPVSNPGHRKTKSGNFAEALRAIYISDQRALNKAKKPKPVKTKTLLRNTSCCFPLLPLPAFRGYKKQLNGQKSQSRLFYRFNSVQLQGGPLLNKATPPLLPPLGHTLERQTETEEIQSPLTPWKSYSPVVKS
jgi:hypothetical protein